MGKGGKDRSAHVEEDIRPSLTERLGYHGLGKLGPHWAIMGLENLWE